jgi:5'(3')-deoxyribonucleotidase
LKPVLLLDCDEVLADFTAATLSRVAEATGHQYTRADIHTWEIFDSISEPEWVKDVVYRNLKAPGGCASMPVCEGAREGVEQVHAAADIVIVTHPFEGSMTWAAEREAWLEAQFGGLYRGVVHTKHKELVHGDLFLDDKPKNVTAWLDYWVRAYRDRKCIGIHWENGRTINEERDPLFHSTSNWDDVESLIRVRASMR